MLFVNVYEITREYGGHEEGGWYYNNYNCIESKVADSEQSAKLIKIKLEQEYGPGYGNIYSVQGGMKISVRVEDEKAQSETTEVPMYE